MRTLRAGLWSVLGDIPRAPEEACVPAAVGAALQRVCWVSWLTVLLKSPLFLLTFCLVLGGLVGPATSLRANFCPRKKVSAVLFCPRLDLGPSSSSALQMCRKSPTWAAWFCGPPSSTCWLLGDYRCITRLVTSFFSSWTEPTRPWHTDYEGFHPDLPIIN